MNDIFYSYIEIDNNTNAKIDQCENGSESCIRHYAVTGKYKKNDAPAPGTPSAEIEPL